MTEPTDKQAINARIAAKVAAMSDEQKEARVEELFAKNSLTADEVLEFSAIMLGGSDRKALDARLAAKVASMNADQRVQRMAEITASPDRNSREMTLEFAKLVFGPDATVEEEEPPC